MRGRLGCLSAGWKRRHLTERPGRRLALASVTALAAGLVGIPAQAVAVPATAPDPLCAPEAADVSAALTMAAECGVAVEALSERTEHTKVTVSPSGTATLVSAVSPQWVRRADGSWADVDTSLRTRADGSLAPVATVADVQFSGGGPGPLVTWREGDSTFTLSWPYGPLPTPRIEGDTAVYPEVFPGVDLNVTAIVDGFQHVLAVKSPAAAANPAVREIRYVLGGDLDVMPAEDGTLAVVDASGTTVAVTSNAVMWDSTMTIDASGEFAVGGRLSAGGRLLAGGEQVDPPSGAVSDARQPGDTAAVKSVDVTVAGDDLVVIPDPGMLSDPSTVFPVYIDPVFNKQRSKWAYATSNGENNDTTNARVGLNPATGARYRSYFMFDTSAIKNTTVLSAKIQIELDHSWSCGPTWVHLYQTAAFSVSSGGRISWSALPLGSSAKWLDSWEGNAHEVSPCPQQNTIAVFEHADLLNAVKEQVKKTSSYFVGLCACNSSNQYESAQERWKRFETHNAYMIVTYDLAPYKPVGLPHLTTTDCYQQCSSPAVVRTTTPRLRASVQDPFGGVLLTAFEIRDGASDSANIVVENSQLRATVSTKAVTSPGTSPAATAEVQVPTGKLVNGRTYYWRATTRDENNLWSGWGSWQSFTVDTVAPGPVSISSSQYPAKEWGAEVGTGGTFTFSGTSDVADFTWWVDSGASTTVSASGSGSKTASVSYTPTTDMVHTMWVRARDTAGNISGNTEHQFWVSPLANRCWNWRLNETSGTTAADSGNSDPADPACGPIGNSITPQPGTLSGSVGFVAGKVGNAAGFTGSGGRIATAGPVLDTTKSFTVMAWVRAADLSARQHQTILSQDGAQASRFMLRYDATANGGSGGWCFAMRATDDAAVAPVSACATGWVGDSQPPAEGEWVHLAGIYDAVTGTIQIHVMGNQDACNGEMAEADVSGSWAAAGSFVIGQAKSSAGSEAWLGDVDHVYAFQRPLAPVEICQQVG